MTATIAEFGGLDVLVNNVGVRLCVQADWQIGRRRGWRRQHAPPLAAHDCSGVLNCPACLRAQVHIEAGVPCHLTSIDAFDKMIAVNLRSCFAFSKVRYTHLSHIHGNFCFQ